LYLNTSVDIGTNHFENDCRTVLSWCGISDLEFKTIKNTTVRHKNTTLIDFRYRERAHGRQATVSVAYRGRPSRMMVTDGVVLKLNFENVRRRYDWRGCATRWTGQLRARPLQPDGLLLLFVIFLLLLFLLIFFRIVSFSRGSFSCSHRYK